MKIELHEIPVYEVTKGYIDNAENGVIGYDGRLNIRPAFQREFIYKEKERNEVIRTIKKNFPLNVMYWVKSDDGNFELLDGQEEHLHIRAFSPKMARSAYERQKGICPKCNKHFPIEQMQADHIKPWSKGGKTMAENCQMLCQHCNATKSDKY